MVKALNPLPRGTKRGGAAEPGAVLMATERIVWYDTAPCPDPQERLFGKEKRCGTQHVIQSGAVFRSFAEIKAKGLDEKTINGLVKRGCFVYRTLENFVRGDLIGRKQTPIVLGNTTGSDEGDKSIGKVQANRPDVPFGYHPDNLKSRDLGELQAMIAEFDPSITAPDSVEGCVEILCSNYDSK